MPDTYIHPDLREAWRTRSELPKLDNLAKIRDEALRALPSVTRYLEVPLREWWISRPGTPSTMRVHVYGTADPSQSLKPGILWLHGGGYILGNLQNEEGFCRRLAFELNAVIAVPEYRLAPEYPFPAGLEDCYTALQWLADQSQTLGVDKTRLAVAGNSAGGGLAAALSLLARDRGGPPICFQMPLYPMIDDRNVTESSHAVVDSRAWNRDHNVVAWQLYLGRTKEEGVSPYAAPARATNLADLPPVYTMVGTYDVFRDETIDYVNRLAQAGVPVEFHLYPGGFHAFEFEVPDATLSRRAQMEYVDALRRGTA
jgi:acetyl esterase/lipase